ncbi:T9SS type A sorting domain-containing protein, partial [Bacteroidia bacterium]|nr:T9SS type A sorting domain-containing protein [Bacteroidia bacterium]
SDTNSVKLYHPGHYLTWPPTENVIVWEITDKEGNNIAKETFTNSSDFLFSHNISLTDTMNVSALLTNDSVGVACFIEDQLYWKITEVLPGIFLGRWSILKGNVGVDVTNTANVEELRSRVDDNLISIYPNPAKDQITVSSSMTIDSYRIFNSLGQIVMNGNLTDRLINIESLNSGSYFIVFEQLNSSRTYHKKIIK